MPASGELLAARKRISGLEALAAGVLLTVFAIFGDLSAQAAENGVNWYLLGVKGPGAALTPPEGLYIQNDLYGYSGSVSRNRELPLNGYVAAGVQGKAAVDLLTALWVTPTQIAGGRLAFSLTQPYGGPTISASATAVGPFGRRGALTVGATDSASFFGDPVASAFLSYGAGPWFYQAGASVNVPIGYYDTRGFANMSFHRWAGDLFASATWLHPESGIDFSTTVGFTFNGTNSVTDYHTGDEVHLEASLSKALSKQFSVGVVSYFYKQVTPDSGAGATLGAFEGRVAALGATASYSFVVSGIPVSTRIKVFREFAERNRLGDATVGFFTLAMPLWSPHPPPQ